MNSVECTRQEEVLEVLRSGQWPERCGEETRAHIDACADCAELVEVAGALLFDHQALTHAAEVPPSGVVWWRAQRRSQQETVRTATRVATAVQTIFVACGAFVFVGLLMALGLDSETFAQIKNALSIDWSNLLSREAIAQWSTPLLVGLGATLFLAPVALYFAFVRE